MLQYVHQRELAVEAESYQPVHVKIFPPVRKHPLEFRLSISQSLAVVCAVWDQTIHQQQKWSDLSNNIEKIYIYIYTKLTDFILINNYYPYFFPPPRCITILLAVSRIILPRQCLSWFLNILFIRSVRSTGSWFIEKKPTPISLRAYVCNRGHFFMIKFFFLDIEI